MSATTTASTQQNPEIIVDIFGPIIDISNMPFFRELPSSTRHLDVEYIRAMLQQKYPSFDNWTAEKIFEKISEALNSAKIKKQLIDRDVLKLLCNAKKRGITIKIKNDVDETSSEAKKMVSDACTAIKDYSKYLYKCDEKFSPLIENDFDFTINDINVFLTSKQNDGTYRVVFDEGVTLDTLADNKNNFEWISIINDKEYMQKLTNAIIQGQRIRNIDNVITGLTRSDQINLANYAIMNNKPFYVFDEDIRTELNNNILHIKNLLTTRMDKEKPICIFLAGAPGTGKSYFVDNFADHIEAHVISRTSLSGVAEEHFTNAITKHVHDAFNEATCNKNHVAFLDEVDTESASLAFRFLMNPMTGTNVNAEGCAERRQVNNLVWIFAGSAYSTPEEFIAGFSKDRKVTDFFDRVHFNLVLPTVDTPGQAILAFIISLKKSNPTGHIKIEKRVLHLFGRTAWKSVRQISTICRIVQSTTDFDWNNIKLENFENVNSLSEFIKAREEITKNYSRMTDLITVIDEETT